MSFKLFLLQTFGRLKPTEKIEARRQSLWNDYQEFIKVDKSDELKKLYELEQFVNSDAFEQRKKEVEALKFKGSLEYNQLQEYHQLEGARHIKNYFKVEKSPDLTRYETIKESEKLAEYYALQDYVENGQYQEEKDELKSHVFKGSPEEKHLKEFRKIKNSKPVKAYFELDGSGDLKAHEEFGSSGKLNRFLELKNAPDNDKEQKKELKSLKRDPDIRKYFRFEKSAKLKYYHEVKGSHLLARYHELKELINSDEFKKRKAWLEDKKKFEKSEAHKKFIQFRQLQNDGDVKFFLNFEKSKLYRNYLDIHDSFDLKRYFELKGITETEDFRKRKAYLEDTKKWEKTEEFAKQQEYLKMKSLPHFIRYFKYKGGNDFDFFKEWEPAFEEQFNSATLDESKWSPMGYWAKKVAGGNFSQPGDLQCFSDGNNIITGKKGLAIQVRKENTRGKYWNPAAGFVPADFAYTSGQLTTGDAFRAGDGIIEAKIKFNPSKEIVSFFYLISETTSPHVNILEMGAKNRMGIFSSENNKISFTGTSIANLKSGKYYLFRLERSDSQFTWKINEQVIFETAGNNYNFPMHLNLASIVVKDVPASKLPAGFEVAWIKCYVKKQK